MTTLTVPATTNFIFQFLNNIDVIDFTNLVGEATAIFSASQFNNIAILDTVTIDGSIIANKIEVRNGSVDASLWQFTNWGGRGDSITFKGTAAGDAITGSSAADIIEGRDGVDILEGGAGDDVISGGGDADQLEGGAQNDQFVYSSRTDDGSGGFGESVDGGSGSADKIILDGDFDGLNLIFAAIENVEAAVFRTAGFATFSGLHVRSGGIATISGSSGRDQIEILGSDIDLSGVTFRQWTEDPVAESSDFIFAYGIGASGDTIIGSDMADLIHGFGGDDTLEGGGGNDILYGDEGDDTISGGSGDDTIDFNRGAKVEDGESIDGDAGNDTLKLHEAAPGEIYDFTGCLIDEIETLNIIGPAQNANLVTAVFAEGQFGSGGINAATISSPLLIRFSGGVIDLSAVTFSGAALEKSSTILTGIAGNDVLNGGSLSDIITGGAFVDVMTGEAGDDTFRYNAGTEILAGEYIGGGADTDTIELSGSLVGNADFSAAIIEAIERLSMLGAGQKAIFGADQLTTFTEIEGNSGKQSLIVTADTIDLSALSFTNWSERDIVRLTGTTGADTITGSSERDIITGLDGDDLIDAGTGDDKITGGLGRDEMTGGEGADRFIYESLDDTPTGTSRDRIQDFTQGDDVIVINVAGFTFIEDSVFSDSGVAEINYEAGTSATTINLDSDGDGIAEAKIVLTGVIDLTNADLILL